MMATGNAAVRTVIMMLTRSEAGSRTKRRRTTGVQAIVVRI